MEAGLAQARKERVGRRPRTVYSITPAGRRALRRWLSEPSREPTFEVEHILKVLFADQGTKEQLLGSLSSLVQWAQQRIEDAAAYARDYLDTGGPFPERLGIIALMGGYSIELYEAIRRWALEAIADVEHWSDTKHAEPDRDVFRRVIGVAEAIRSQPPEHGAPAPRSAFSAGKRFE